MYNVNICRRRIIFLWVFFRMLSKEKKEKNKCRRDCKTEILYSADWPNIVQKYADSSVSLSIQALKCKELIICYLVFFQELRFRILFTKLQSTPKLFSSSRMCVTSTGMVQWTKRLAAVRWPWVRIPGPAPPKWGHPRWMNSPQEAPLKFVDE